MIAGALIVPEDLDFLVGIYAFGALLGLTIAHLSIIVAALPRARPRAPLPDAADRAVPRRRRCRCRRSSARCFSAAAWVSVVITHAGARYVGFGWMAFGLVTYVVYRRTQGKSLLKRVMVPEAALTHGARASSSTARSSCR